MNTTDSPSPRTVLVTGASSDSGLAVCKLLLAQGHKVIGHHRNPRQKFDDLAKSSPNFKSFQMDFSDPSALESEIKNRRDFFTQADALINLAADLSPGSFEDATADAMMAAFKTNVLPGLMLMQAMGPAMAERGWGRIVHASSIGVKFGGGWDSFSYSLSKHALEFIPGACRKWAEDNVLSNVVRIGVTDTRIHDAVPGKNMAARIDMIPMGRAGTADEVARAICWLGSEENTYITGQLIPVSGGE